MKYMIMMFGGMGETLQDRSPEWISDMQKLLMGLDAELRESGELVDSQKLMDPAAAKTVRYVASKAAPTDGPFAEVKESLAGYWIIEATEERALEIASTVVDFIEFPMEVRQIMDQPRSCDDPPWSNLSRSCCASSLRRFSPRSPGSTGTSTAVRTPPRRRCSPP